MMPHPPGTTLFPYTTLFRSTTAREGTPASAMVRIASFAPAGFLINNMSRRRSPSAIGACSCCRSEEHTSELQSRFDLVCRLLLEKKKNKHASHSRSLRTHHL